MLKRTIATATAFCAVGAAAVLAAPAASAQEANFACRSDNTQNHAWANWGGANVDSCVGHDPRDYDSPVAGIGVNNAYPSDPCAQLIDATNHKQVYDFGCYDTWSGTGAWLPAFSGNKYFNVPSWKDIRTTDAVYIQVGFWANFGSGLQYYMNVESPMTSF